MVSLLYFWLNSVELAKMRVAHRVKEGGHNIPEEVIERRYHRGIKNLFDLYLPICDNVMVFDYSENTHKLIYKKTGFQQIDITDEFIFRKIYNGKHQGN